MMGRRRCERTVEFSIYVIPQAHATGSRIGFAIELQRGLILKFPHLYPNYGWDGELIRGKVRRSVRTTVLEPYERQFTLDNISPSLMDITSATRRAVGTTFIAQVNGLWGEDRLAGAYCLDAPRQDTHYSPDMAHNAGVKRKPYGTMKRLQEDALS